MCMVSAIHDYGRKLPPLEWTPDILETFKDALKRAEAYDEKTHQKDCLDPQKAEFLKDVEKLLEEKYGMKKFDWEVGDRVENKNEKPVFNNKTFRNDLTLRSGASGIIIKIEHSKTEVTVEVQFDVIPNNSLKFYGTVGTEKLNEQLINISSIHRNDRSFSGGVGGTSGGSTGVPLNNNIKIT